MKQKTSVNENANKVKDKIIPSRKQSLWKLICPCFRSKSLETEKCEQQKDSYIREEFYEEKTINQDNVHQETQTNLPVNFGGSKIQIDNQKNLQKQKQNLRNFVKQSDSCNQPGTVKFNIKRNSNFGGYLNEKKPSNSKNEGKQNSKPNIIELSDNQRFPSKRPSTIHTSQNQNQLLNPSSNKKGMIMQKLSNNKMKINRQQLISIEKQLQKMQGLGDYEFLQRWQDSYENNYPINSMQENRLMVVGNKTNKLLVKITSAKVFPSASSVQRYKQSIKNKQLSQKNDKNSKQKQKGVGQNNSSLDRYWDKRYFLFERFDEGIKLDEESWYSVTPEAVADYVSSKVNVKNVILDAFCGAGGDCLKLATSCAKIIANDIDQVKLKCLLNNAKIYDINNITINCSDFFKIDCKVDAVYLAPPWGGPDYYKIESFHPDEFQPKLSLIIEKAFSLSHNIFFLLPANTDVEALSSIICEKARKIKDFKPQSCALKIQKIYFNERLKFIAGFFGNTEVQNDIKLSEELGFIYDLLRDHNDTIFKHKKLVRKIREEYGMINLLNFVFECQAIGQDQYKTENGWTGEELSMIEKFEKLLLVKRLIDQKTLQKIKQEQQAEYEYGLKNREQKNKKQKNKMIQKHKEKQQRQLSIENPSNGQHLMNKKEQCPQDQIESENAQIPISQIIKQAHKYNKNLHKRNQTIESNIDIQSSGMEQSEKIPARDSIRTVSMISQFQEDQLRNIGNYERLTGNSEISIMDSIHPIQKYDDFDISIDASLRISHESGQLFPFSAQKRQQLSPSQEPIPRHSEPSMFSPRQHIQMKKVKVGKFFERGIQEANQQRERDQ